LAGRTWVTGPNVGLVLHGEEIGTNPIALTGVIDTGASVICVDSRIVRQLGLVASKRKVVHMADGRAEMATIYPVRMT
jgi:hypothetical protein